MAKPILEDQAVDYSKPFDLELSFTDSDGRKRRVVKTTYPMKTTVKQAAERGARTPWDAPEARQ